AIKGLRGQHAAFMEVVDEWTAEGEVGHVRHADGGLDIICLGETFRALPKWVTHEGKIHATEYALRPIDDPDGEPIWTFYLRDDLLCATPSQANVLVSMKHAVAQKTILYDLGNALLLSGRFVPRIASKA